jgi:SAM-dependent methyltransferase
VGTPHASICIFGWDEMETIVGLKDLGHKVLGVDRSASALRRAHDQGLDVFKGSAEAPPPEILETPFDAVFLSNALSSCLEPRVALENAHRLLNPGGHLFAEAPNHDAHSARRAGPVWPLFEAGRNVNFFTGNSLTRFVESTGFRVDDVLYRQMIPQTYHSRLIAEREIANRIYGNDKRLDWWNATIGPWARLLRLVFLSTAQRFEIVGVIATKQAG